MKSYTALVFAASLALTSAQVTYNQTTGVFTCAKANAAYCAGDSLSTNIIIRCNGFVGQPGNCNDNLDGEFPFGLSFAPCYQTSPTSGEAACSKNCIVYGGSGTIDGTFSLPGCVPSATQSTSASATSTVSASSSPASIPLTTVTYSYTTVTVPCNSTTSPIILSTFLSTHPTPISISSVLAPFSNSTITITASSGPSGGSGPTPISNSTFTITTSSGPNGGSGPSSISNTTAITSGGPNGGSGGSGGSEGNGRNGGNGGSATATPVGPTTTVPAPFSGAATANQAGAFVVAAGFLVAALL